MSFSEAVEIFVSRVKEGALSSKPLGTHCWILLTITVVTYFVEHCTISMHISSFNPHKNPVSEWFYYFTRKETQLRRLSSLFLSTYLVSGGSETSNPLMPIPTNKRLF